MNGLCYHVKITSKLLTYVPVKKRKLQHPPPPPPQATPWTFEFLENRCSNPLSLGQKAVQMCPIIGPFQVIKCPYPRDYRIT